MATAVPVVPVDSLNFTDCGLLTSVRVQSAHTNTTALYKHSVPSTGSDVCTIVCMCVLRCVVLCGLGTGAVLPVRHHLLHELAQLRRLLWVRL